MSTRREFIQNTAALTLGGILINKNAFGSTILNKNKLPEPGIQLFTVFNEMKTDPTGTLKKIVAAGYKNIESAFDFYGQTPKEFFNLCRDLVLQWRAHHVSGAPFKMPPESQRSANFKIPLGPDGKPMTFPKMKNLKENGTEIVDLVAEGGIKYLVCANMPISSVDELKEAVDILHITAEKTQKAGIQLMYHNHTSEFKKIDDLMPYDYLLTELSADELKMELDLGWALTAGKDPVEIFKNNPNRFPLWHIKDMDAAGNILPFGKGELDFKAIFENASIAGLEYFFIEQDFPEHPLEDIKISIQNFNKFKLTF